MKVYFVRLFFTFAWVSAKLMPADAIIRYVVDL